MPASVTLKALGLNTSTNQLEVPPGSLIEAKNVVIRDNDIVSQRRGFSVYGETFGSSSDRVSQLFSYRDRILRYFGNTIQFDAGIQTTSGVEIFKDFDGSYSPAKTGLKIKSIESNGNLYFTTSNGIQKISAKNPSQFTTDPVSGALTDAGIVTKAGGVKAIDLNANIIYQFGNQSGFLPEDSAVAYRVLWLYNDANKNLIQGTPSQRVEVFNSLLPSSLRDYNFVLGALDDINQPGSLIRFGNFVSQFRLPINASALDLYNNLLLLVTQLDDSILYADQTSPSSIAPFQISLADIVNNDLTINFNSYSPSMISVSNYFISGNNILLNGFTFTNSSSVTDSTNTNGVNGKQVVASTFEAIDTGVVTATSTTGVAQVTNVTTVADSGGNLAGTYFDINSANDVTKYYVWFNVSGTGVDPSISGRTGIRVNIVTNDTANTVAASITTAINNFASADFTAVNTGGPSAIVDITNTDDGPSVDADGGTSGFTVTTTTPGSVGNVLTSVIVPGTINLTIGSHITGTNIPSDTYVKDFTFTTITLSKNVTGSGAITDLAFDGGIKINTNLVGTITESLATINDYTFESIEQPIAPGTPATNQDLVNLQTFLSEIITNLQNMSNSVISSNLLSLYIDPLDVTTSSNVELQITIPSNVTSYDFFQIYRSDIAQATGTTVLNDLSPNDELKLVYEAFPTTDELTARSIKVIDIVPDVFRGANLYTNEASGIGLAQAFDLPPYSLDVNRYKNVTFYANTKTLQRRIISLLGVINMINDYGSGLNSHTFSPTDVDTTTDTITIIGHGYTEAQSIEFHNSTPSNLPGGITASQTYYILNVDTDTFQISLTKGGIPVDLTSQGSGTHTVYNQLPSLIITNGTTKNTYKFITGQNESTKITTGAGSTLNASGTASYFNLNSANDAIEYFVWYQIGTSTEPVVNGKTGIQVVALASDTAVEIAEKTANTISQYIADFLVDYTSGDNFFVVTNTINGDTTNPSDSSSPTNTGFTFLNLVEGVGEDKTTQTVLLSNLVSSGRSVDETARSLVRIINQNSDEIVNAFYLSTSGGVPGQIFLEDKNLSDQPFYILGNNENTGISFSPNISPEGFIIGNTVAFLTIVQTTIPHDMINGDQVVIINSNSTPVINGLYDITFINSTHFSIPVNVTSAGNTGSFIKASNALFSDNEEKINRLYYSVFQQPDAVPLVNFMDVGSGDKAILRIIPLRDSLFVFKEDGLFRVSGEVAPFVTALFDSSVIVIAPDSVAVSNNMIFAWTTRGIVIVTEGGIQNISNNSINDIVKPLSSATFPAFSTATWGIGYESDNSYMVFTLRNPEDTIPQLAYRYDQITNTWTTIEKDFNCGVIHQLDDKMYTGSGDQNTIEKERKTFTRYDFADRELPLDLTPGQYFDTMLKFLTDISDITAGDVLVQEQLLTIYQFNQTLKKLDIDPGLTVHDYYSSIHAISGDNLRTKIIQLATKLDSDTGVTDIDYLDSIDTKAGFIQNIQIANPAIITTVSPHELQNGRIITITGSNSDPLVDDTYPVTVTSASTFTIPVNVDQTAGTTGTFATIDTDFRDIQACYNFIINKMNLDTGIAFSNYQPSLGTTIQESIITDVNNSKKEIDVNLTLPYIQGPMIVFKSIPTSITYCPITFDDPLSLKHIRELTAMFANKAFTTATMNIGSDLLPQFKPVTVIGDGNGIFGYSGNNIGFGSNFFGGTSHGAPFRTYIPAEKQMCIYLNIQFQHNIAREMYKLFGITLTGETGISSRAYR